MNPVLKKKISILIHLAGIDGEFAKVEKSYIMELCNRNGVSSRECEQLISNPDPIGSLGALSYDKDVEYMSECLSLMIIDGKIRQSEVLLCEDIALRLGFHKLSIDQVIDKLKGNLNLPVNKIAGLIKELPHTGKT